MALLRPCLPGPGQRPRRGLALTACLLLLGLLVPRRAAADEQSPIYVIEAIQIEGNDKTRDHVILDALLVAAGERLSVDDPRFELSRFRLLATGYFSSVRLRLRKGSARGKAILVVRVRERGTIVLTDLFFGASESTTAWGGLGLAENNFLGHGLTVGGAFVIGADPDVDRGAVQQAYRLGLSAERLGSTSLSLAVTLLFLDGSDFFRRAGSEWSSDPRDFLSIRYQRIGGSAGLGLDLGRSVRLFLDYRGEYLHAEVPPGSVRTLPDGSSTPIDFEIKDGQSVLSLLQSTLEWDTRSDPVLPHRGSLLSISADFSSTILGSGYDYFKLSGLFKHYFYLSWGHILSMQLFGGVVFGEAPFFERFFIGDLNDLLPSRALGLNFSTQPSRDFFGTAIDAKRYEEFAARVALEYIVPWFRGGRFFYNGDFFFNVGVLMLNSREAWRVRDRSLSESVPIDLTLDTGLRLDTAIGVFRLSIGNALGRIPF